MGGEKKWLNSLASGLTNDCWGFSGLPEVTTSEACVFLSDPRKLRDAFQDVEFCERRRILPFSDRVHRGLLQPFFSSHDWLFRFRGIIPLRTSINISIYTFPRIVYIAGSPFRGPYKRSIKIISGSGSRRKSPNSEGPRRPRITLGRKTIYPSSYLISFRKIFLSVSSHSRQFQNRPIADFIDPMKMSSIIMLKNFSTVSLQL